jgi:hypothetical protein
MTWAREDEFPEEGTCREPNPGLIVTLHYYMITNQLVKYRASACSSTLNYIFPYVIIYVMSYQGVVIHNKTRDGLPVRKGGLSCDRKYTLGILDL